MVLILEYFVQLRLSLTHIVDDDLAALQFSNQISSKKLDFRAKNYLDQIGDLLHLLAVALFALVVFQHGLQLVVNFLLFFYLNLAEIQKFYKKVPTP
jgi:hypothetical protein